MPDNREDDFLDEGASKLLPAEALDAGFKIFRLPRDREPDLRFTGKLVAEVSSARPKCELWRELSLYKTFAGQWALHDVGRSDRPGHRDKYRVIIAATDDELVEQSGRGPLSQELYDEAGIDDVEEL